jgi:hypothetical protein
VLYAEEYNTGRPVVRMHYYGSVPVKPGLDALIANPDQDIYGAANKLFDNRRHA